MSKFDKKAMTVTFPLEDWIVFTSRYPACLHQFLRSAVHIAVSDVDFFNKVMFPDLTNEQ